ncbi:nuclear transport factor 2 family protein [Pseudomonas stutzeri]|nr:nuclear transport factor 2 family protein [Stutzerimonas stutzeri]
MTDSALAITNLLHRYAEAIDAGRLEEAAALFRHTRIQVQGSDAGLLSPQMLEISAPKKTKPRPAFADRGFCIGA